MIGKTSVYQYFQRTKELQMQKLLTVVLAAAAVLSPVAWANDAHHTVTTEAVATEAAGFAANEGEIRKVNKEQGKLTIKHGPFPNLDMPNMTMVFKVKDLAMLDQVTEGDKVKLQVEKVNGALTVTELSKR